MGSKQPPPPMVAPPPPMVAPLPIRQNPLPRPVPPSQPPPRTAPEPQPVRQTPTPGPPLIPRDSLSHPQPPITPQAAQPPPRQVAPLPQGIKPLPPIPNPLLGNPLAITPKSGSDRSPPEPAPLATGPQPIPMQVPRPSASEERAPKQSSPKSGTKQVIPSSGPGTPQNIASPAPQEGMPGGVPVRKSAQNTPLGGTPAVSARSAVAVEFVPATEYVDVSKIAFRFLQLLFLGELLFHLCAMSYGMHFAELYFVFEKTFSVYAARAALVSPAALGLAAILTIRTIYGVFSINFTTPSGTGLTIRRLIALFLAHVIYGLVLIVAGIMFKSMVTSDNARGIIKTNLAHLIRFSTKDVSYMKGLLNIYGTHVTPNAVFKDIGRGKFWLMVWAYGGVQFVSCTYDALIRRREINRLQQQFQCCGMKGNISNETTNNGVRPDHPWNVWFDSYTLDETYPSAIRELYSLPWSCCNLTSGMKCEHIGISRYQRNFANPTDFNDVETALHVFELHWNPGPYQHYLDRNRLAIETLYSRDCSEELFSGVEENTTLIESLMFKAGIIVLAFSVLLLAVIVHVRLVLQSGAAQAGKLGKRAPKSSGLWGRRSGRYVRPSINVAPNHLVGITEEV